MKSQFRFSRRTFLVATFASVVRVRCAEAQSQATRPAISEADCPLEVITPVARDGHKGLAVLRKPPGRGPFPVIVWLHGGLTTSPLDRLQSYARDAATYTRLLAAGYVVVGPTYRSRDDDPQSPVSLTDSLAAIEHVLKLPYVDADSIVVAGCSGGAELALEVAGHTSICAVVAEEPAGPVLAGMFNNRVPKKGDRYSPEDATFLLENPKQHYTPEFQKILRTRIAPIHCPILIIQGDVDRRDPPINKFNAEVIIPELHAAKKTVEVRTYAAQGHCFCAGSGLRRSSGRPTPASAQVGDVETARRLIEQGADLNNTSAVVGPALNIALFQGQTGVAQLLIERGADLQLKSLRGYGTSPMVLSGYNTGGDATIARLLVARGVDVNTANEADETALSFALKDASDNELIQFLRGAGAKLTDAPVRAKIGHCLTLSETVPKIAPARDVPTDAADRTAMVRDGAQRAVDLLQRSSTAFLQNKRIREGAKCVTCHQQSLPAIAFGWARERGLRVDEHELVRQLATTFDLRKTQMTRALELDQPTPGATVALG